jgi:hypothetical protein
VEATPWRPLRVGSTQSNMSMPRATAQRQPHRAFELGARRRQPDALVELHGDVRSEQEFRKALSRPDVIDAVGRVGLLARGSTPAELGAYVKEQFETWSRALREAGVPLE